MALAAFDKWRPSRFYIEDTANATALIQQLRSEAHLPIIPVKATASKESRAEGVSGLVESGRIVLPHDAPWLASFEDEVCSFPSGDHDDQVDAFVLALAEVGRRKFAFDGIEPTSWHVDDEPTPELNGDPLIASVARVWGSSAAERIVAGGASDTPRKIF